MTRAAWLRNGYDVVLRAAIEMSASEHEVFTMSEEDTEEEMQEVLVELVHGGEGTEARMAAAEYVGSRAGVDFGNVTIATEEESQIEGRETEMATCIVFADAHKVACAKALLGLSEEGRALAANGMGLSLIHI